MTFSKNFDKDLAVGKEKEYAVCKVIKRQYPEAFVIEGKEIGYDIYVPEKAIKVEVKYDKKSDETGNYFIEIEDNGKPSGINVTTADWWALVDKEMLLWIKPDTLKYVIYTVLKCPEISFGINGNGKKRGYLINKLKLKVSPYVLLQKWT